MLLDRCDEKLGTPLHGDEFTGTRILRESLLRQRGDATDKETGESLGARGRGASGGARCQRRGAIGIHPEMI